MTSSVKGAPAAQLIAVLGAGGVGKTTTAAALALGLAERGLRVAVITVDPARRLAQALGLESLSNSPREVTSFANGGKLSALWLDARGAFEDLVRKYSSQPESAERILNNRLFKILQSQLGGIEEYLGVEKVLSLGRSGDFDVCVLDTPPSRHALDFLESPRHLIRFFDESVLRVFVKEDGAEEKSGFFSKILRSGRQQAIEIFKNFLGKSFLAELGELLTNLKPVHKIFTETAEAIEEWVRLPRTRFVGVSLLEPYPLDEIRLLGLELSARELPELQMVVLNKCLPDAAPPPIDELTRALGPDSAHGLTAHF
ncbi:MAG: ArsA family ATPase, partial [Bdellovibrionales bacterium]|nr:ArsA family ATPase [Bdellovibrionales bacterium]